MTQNTGESSGSFMDFVSNAFGSFFGADRDTAAPVDGQSSSPLPEDLMDRIQNISSMPVSDLEDEPIVASSHSRSTTSIVHPTSPAWDEQEAALIHSSSLQLPDDLRARVEFSPGAQHQDIETRFQSPIEASSEHFTIPGVASELVDRIQEAKSVSPTSPWTIPNVSPELVDRIESIPMDDPVIVTSPVTVPSAITLDDRLVMRVTESPMALNLQNESMTVPSITESTAHLVTPSYVDSLGLPEELRSRVQSA